MIDLTPLEKRPLLALGSLALLLVGGGLALLGLSLPLIAWLAVFNTSFWQVPVSSYQSILAEQQMLNYAGFLIAASGAPILLLGIILVGIIWLVL